MDSLIPNFVQIFKLTRGIVPIYTSIWYFSEWKTRLVGTLEISEIFLISLYFSTVCWVTEKNREKNVKRFSRVQESNPALPSSFLLYIHLFIFHGYKIFVCYAINIICNISNHTYIFDIMILYQCIEIISILPFNLNLIIFDALMCTIVYEIYWYFFQVEYAHI